VIVLVFGYKVDLKPMLCHVMSCYVMSPVCPRPSTSSQEEQRRAAYGADVTYVTNSELGFDYLRDNLAQVGTAAGGRGQSRKPRTAWARWARAPAAKQPQKKQL
jgi:hypothetical protein